MEDVLVQCIVDLHAIGVIKFGSFTLKSGMQSPIYFDLRVIVSHPKIMETVAKLLWATRPNTGHDLLCGVAYTGLPIATVISLREDIPMLIRRKETKSYGTKKMVEGNYKEGQKCLIVEDVIVSGSSIYETVETLVELGLDVKEAVVFLDREQGAVANLASLGVMVYPVLTMTKMLSILHKQGIITSSVQNSVMEFVRSHSDTHIATKETSIIECKNLTFESRMATTSLPLTRTIFELISIKKTNLCVAADVTTSEELLSLADKVGPHICLLKTHVDIIQDFTQETVEKLKALADKHNFFLFEDRKFGDIGNTVAQQYSGGQHRIVKWAHLVTVHGLPGDGVIKGLASVICDGTRGCLLVCEMSSAGALTSKEYLEGCKKMAEGHPYFVAGFIAQSKVSSDPGFILFTPGVQLKKTTDDFGQQYVTPRVAVLERCADVIIVGRGITQAEDPTSAAQTYKEEAFAAYEERVSHKSDAPSADHS